MTYTFHIRAGQRFANGTPVTAADYAYSFNRSLNPCVASPVAYYLFQLKDARTFSNENCHNGVFSRSTYPPQQGPLLTTLIGDSIVASDPATLVVTLAQPGAYFLTALTYPVDAALDPTAIGPDPSSERWLDGLTSGQGTSGMFIVHTWDHANGKIVLIPNPHWWGQSAGKRPYLTEIDFSMVRDSDQAYSDFEHGRYDVGFPPVAAQAEAHSRAQFHAVLALTVQALMMDWTRPPYDNPDARLALCLAINRDALNRQVYGGAMLPSWHIVPQGMPGYNPALTGPDGVSSPQGDPAAARAHWQAYLQPLYGAQPPSMAYFYDSSSRSQTSLATALAQQWQATLGIAVTPRAIIFGYLQDTNYAFPLSRFIWTADYPDPQDFLSMLVGGNAQFVPRGVSVPGADKLMQQADATSDPTQRYALDHQAEQLDVNAVALCPLLQDVNYYLMRDAVHGWQLDGRGLTPNDAWLATYLART